MAPKTTAELLEIIDDLNDAWDTGTETVPFHPLRNSKNKRIEGLELVRGSAILGLGRHVVKTAQAIRLLIDNDMATSAIPLTRMVFECALTSALLANSKDDHGVKSMLKDYARFRGLLKSDSMQAATETFRDGAQHITDDDMTPFSGSYDHLRNFQQVCMDLTPAGTDAYIIFRILSAYSHATVKNSDTYFTPNDSEILPYYVPDPDAPIGADFLLWLTAASMVWSGRPVSYVTKDKTHRSELRRCARELGTKADLEVSEAYRQRHIKAKRAAKMSSSST